MSKGVEFTCRVANGRIPPKTAEQIAKVVRNADGKQIIITLAEVKRKRSNQQNAYYWGVVVQAVLEVFREAGNMVDADDVHLFLKLHVGKLAQVIVTPGGKVIKSLGSTAKLSTVEFSNYIERIRAWAMEVLDIDIPSPDEQFSQPTKEGEAA